MTEFGLTLAMSMLAVAIAAMVARPQARNETATRALRETSDTVRVAATSFTRVHAHALFVLVLLVAFVLFVAYGFARPHHIHDPATSAIETAGWIASAFALGATVVLASMHAGVRSALAGGLQLAAATRAPTPSVPVVALRASSTAALLSAALPLVGLAALSCAAWIRLGGLVPQSESIAAVKLPGLIISFGFGACLCGLTARVVGGVFASAADLSASLAGDSAGPLLKDHPKNPAWLARLVARSIDQGVGTCVDTSASIATTCVSSMVLGAALVKMNGARLAAPLGVVLFAPLLLSLGTFASMVGVLVVRSDARELSVRAFDRGLATTVVLSLAAVLACARWVFDAHWGAVSVSCVAGLAAGVLGMVVSRWYAGPSPAVREQLEKSSCASEGSFVLAGASRGTERAAWMMATTAVPLAIAYLAGSKSGLQGGGPYALAIAAAAMHAPASFVGAVRGVFSTASNSAALVSAHSAGASEAHSRSDRLVEVAWAGRQGSSGFASVLNAAVALAVVAALSELTHSSPQKSGMGQIETLGALDFAAASTMGVAVVYWFGARGLDALWRASEAAIKDIRGHVDSGVRRQGTTLTFEESYDPEHQSCFSLLLGDSARQAIPVGLVALGLALGVEVLFQGTASRWGVVFAGEFVGASLIAAATAATILAFALDGAAGVWRGVTTGNATKFKTAVDDAEKRANNSVHGAAIVSDTVGGPIESMTAPSIQALVRVLVTVTVVLAPLFL